jgi:hypothetical protein
MDSTTLVEGKINNGRRLVEALDSRGLRLPVALWMNLDENGWTLVLGVQNLEQENRKILLRRIYQVIRDINSPLSLTDVELVDNRSQRMNMLRMMLTTTGSQITEIPFFGNFINGQKFPDSVIYRIN